MRSSPLQLLRYFVEDISCNSNPNYDSEKEFEFLEDQFRVDTTVAPRELDTEHEDHSWMVEMSIRQQIGPNQNFPYDFKVRIVGFFLCGSNLPNDWSPEYFVKVNGSSVLYGVAREIVRATTARGPWSDVIVPTLSFYEPFSKSDTQETVMDPSTKE
jgi:preprotein translocase subunit SecB